MIIDKSNSFKCNFLCHIAAFMFLMCLITLYIHVQFKIFSFHFLILKQTSFICHCSLKWRVIFKQFFFFFEFLVSYGVVKCFQDGECIVELIWGIHIFMLVKLMRGTNIRPTLFLKVSAYIIGEWVRINIIYHAS